MVLYYSGTGNSRFAARLIHDSVGGDLFSINDALKAGGRHELHSDSPLVFVCPTYCWNLPRVVRDFIIDTSFSGDKRAYFVLSCGDGVGNATRGTEKLCREKALEFMGLFEIVMPENFITMFEAPDEDEAKQIIDAAKPHIEAAALRIRDREYQHSSPPTLAARVLSSKLVGSPFYAFCMNAKKYRVSDSCVHCGKCAANCPLSNIAMTDGKPVWGDNCTQCMACICGCPAHAIEYGNKTRGKTRYYLD